MLQAVLLTLVTRVFGVVVCMHVLFDMRMIVSMMLTTLIVSVVVVIYANMCNVTDVYVVVCVADVDVGVYICVGYVCGVGVGVRIHVRIRGCVTANVAVW